MGADVIKTSLMVGYGNTWTNMCQPFWAIALLGITGLKAKDIMGYSTAIMFCGGLIFIIASFMPMSVSSLVIQVVVGACAYFALTIIYFFVFKRATMKTFLKTLATNKGK